MPGHGIAGHVSAVGSEVTKFRVDDTVGVGCMVDFCRQCREGLEQYCEIGFTGAYDFPTLDTPGHTLGGYSQRIVVRDRFVLRGNACTPFDAVEPILVRLRQRMNKDSRRFMAKDYCFLLARLLFWR